MMCGSVLAVNAHGLGGETKKVKTSYCTFIRAALYLKQGVSKNVYFLGRQTVGGHEA